MQWWNDFVTWFNSAAGTRVITTAILPFLAIVVAGVVAALIARSMAKRVVDHQDREIKAAAIMALIGAGRRAAIWSTLGADEKQHVDALISEADLRMRLLPVSGAIAAADWSTHELGAMKKNSSNFSFQAEQTFFDYRDRLLDWQLKPTKAKKLFAFDLVQWQYEDGDKALVTEPQEWAVDRVDPPAYTSTTPASSTPTAYSPQAAPAAVAAPAVAAPAATAPIATAATASTPTAVTTAATGVPATTSSNPQVANARATNSDAAADAEAEDETDDTYAPPVNAGAVRARTAPEQSLDNS